MKVRTLILLLIIALSLLKVNSAPVTQASVVIFPDGWAEVTLTISGIESEKYEVRIQGAPYDLMVSSNGLLLNYTLRKDSLLIDTLGLGECEVNYQTPSLTSKQGIVWNASISLPSQLTVLLLPPGSTIIGMSKVPEEIGFEGDWLKLTFQTGSLWISYKFETKVLTQRKLTTSNASKPMTQSNPKEEINANLTKAFEDTETQRISYGDLASYVPYLLVLIPMILASVLALKLRKRDSAQTGDEIEKLIIDELRARGGKATQAELTKALGLPRATVWRRLRKLEKEGVLVLERRGNVTTVRLK